MCGACGTAAPQHWSAPFLASQAARATAARAVTALVGPRPAVVAVPAGFLVRQPTGATTVAAHLGAVWKALDRAGLPRPDTDRPPAGISGPVTIPAVRAALLEVQLVLTDVPWPATSSGRVVDGRGADPHQLTSRLHDLAVTGSASTARLVLSPADLPRTLPQLVADPTRPYQLRLPPGTAPEQELEVGPPRVGREHPGPARLGQRSLRTGSSRAPRRPRAGDRRPRPRAGRAARRRPAGRPGARCAAPRRPRAQQPLVVRNAPFVAERPPSSLTARYVTTA